MVWREMEWTTSPISTLGNVHLQNAAVRVVDVHLHLAVVDGLLRIGRHVHRDDRAVRLDHLQLDDLLRGVRQHEGKAESAVVALALFGEDLDEPLVLAFAGAVGVIDAHQSFLHGGLIAVRVFGEGDISRRRQGFLQVHEGPEIA